ncbi:MAG: hypothetical protein JSV64_06775 [Candidatus Bathyarchaeota archaeon]|jgi:hypothetical protein|nr:MAG: hypothetical protein JSV64_06775 [Candidatus Bathyarchaeota archaeon]
MPRGGYTIAKFAEYCGILSVPIFVHNLWARTALRTLVPQPQICNSTATQNVTPATDKPSKRSVRII